MLLILIKIAKKYKYITTDLKCFFAYVHFFKSKQLKSRFNKYITSLSIPEFYF